MQKTDGNAVLCCSLNEAQFNERRVLVRRTLLPHVSAFERSPSGLAVTFPDTEPVRIELENFVELERRCCGFLTFAIDRSSGDLRLLIEGPEEGQATIDMFAGGLGGCGG